MGFSWFRLLTSGQGGGGGPGGHRIATVCVHTGFESRHFRIFVKSYFRKKLNEYKRCSGLPLSLSLSLSETHSFLSLTISHALSLSVDQL